MSIEIVTPPGRIVWGHPIKKSVKTDPKTRRPILKDGKEVDVWAFGLAIPVAQFAPVEQAIAQAAYQVYPQGNFPRDFSWKIKRETDLDENNKPYSDREGYKGCVVLTVSTEAFCPPAFKFENGGYRQLTEQEIKCGDWIATKLNIVGHSGGVYVNPVGHDFVGYDKEIVRVSADPTQMFGGRVHQLPPGVSATPIASGAAPYAPPQAAPVAPAQQPAYAPTMPAAPQYPAPAHDFVNNAGRAPAQPYQMPGIPQGR